MKHGERSERKPRTIPVPVAYLAPAASYRSLAARSAARSSRVMLGDLAGLPSR